MKTHNLINDEENQELVQPFNEEFEKLDEGGFIEEDEDDVLTEENEEDYL